MRRRGKCIGPDLLKAALLKEEVSEPDAESNCTSSSDRAGTRDLVLRGRGALKVDFGANWKLRVRLGILPEPKRNLWFCEAKSRSSSR